MTNCLAVQLTDTQIDLITYCINQHKDEFDEVEKRDYQEILDAIKYASPCSQV